MKRDCRIRETEAVSLIPGKDKGIALVTALIITLVVFLLVASTLYVITQSTNISGAGRRYATAAEAADGAVDLLRDIISRAGEKKPLSDYSNVSLPSSFGDFVLGLTAEKVMNNIKITFPGAGMLQSFDVTATVEWLFTKSGGPTGIIFPPKDRAGGAGGGGGEPIYFRITVISKGPDGSQAESVVLYRYAR